MDSKSSDLTQNTHSSLGQQLRAVGQGLESFDVEDFELQAEGDGYFALGIPRVSHKSGPTEIRSKHAGVPSTLKKALHSLTHRAGANSKGAEAASKVLRILITSEGIRRLDQEGKAKRREDSAGIPSFTKLAQILRMVGEHIDTKSGRLRKALKQPDWISFEYETTSAGIVTEKWQLTELYEFWMQVSNNRQERYEIFDLKPASQREKNRVEPHR